MFDWRVPFPLLQSAPRGVYFFARDVIEDPGFSLNSSSQINRKALKLAKYKTTE